METYGARYKLPGEWWWTKVSEIVGDGIEGNFQFLYLKDKTYIRLPYTAVIEFNPSRHQVTLSRMEKESGQQIKTNF